MYKCCFFENCAGSFLKLRYSAAWYEQFRMEGRRPGTMSNDTAFEEDPAWLTLPLARREVALRRREVMLDYEKHDRAGVAEAKAAAECLNITTVHFYRLRRQWRQNRSIFDLLPHGQPGLARKPKLDRDVADAVSKLIMNAIADDGVRAPAEILKRIRARWPLEKPVPSHMTLRKSISDALEKLTNVSGGLVFVNSSIPQKSLKMATGYGEVVAIDHMILEIFVATEGGPIAPIMTAVIDLYTSSIVGFHLSFGSPGSLQFEAALRDAETQSASAAPNMASVRPRLVFSAGGDSSWSKLLSRIEASDYKANVMRRQRLQFGEHIAPLIGSSIGVVNFASRKWLNDLSFNPDKDALISFDELKKLVEAGVRELNEKRLSASTVRYPLSFAF